MQILRSGTQSDQSDERYKSSGRMVRLIYSMAVMAVIAYALYFFGRPYVVLEGPGIVAAPEKDIAAEHVLDVELVHVKPGDRVYPGVLLFTINRSDYADRLDQIRTTLVDREQDIDRVSQKLKVAERVMLVLRRRVSELGAVVEQTDSHPEIMDLATRSTLHREYAQATVQLEQNRAQREDLPGLLRKLQQNKLDLKKRQSEILVTWKNRHVVARQTGIVGSEVVSEGETVLTGDVMAQILDPRRLYVVWELPERMLRLPRLGERVTVEGIGVQVDGRVDRFAALSNLPTTDNRQRRRLVYVAISNEDAKALPLQSSVTVRMNYFWAD